MRAASTRYADEWMVVEHSGLENEQDTRAFCKLDLARKYVTRTYTADEVDQMTVRIRHDLADGSSTYEY